MNNKLTLFFREEASVFGVILHEEEASKRYEDSKGPFEDEDPRPETKLERRFINLRKDVYHAGFPPSPFMLDIATCGRYNSGSVTFS